MQFLSLICWVGGIIFFSFVTAPTAFIAFDKVTGGVHLAGDVVGRSLNELHILGCICAVVFLISSIALHRKAKRATHLVVVAMAALTLFSQYWITPRIAPLRIEMASKEDFAGRDEFDLLHGMSVADEGTVLMLGLGVVWLTIKDTERG